MEAENKLPVLRPEGKPSCPGNRCHPDTPNSGEEGVEESALKHMKRKCSSGCASSEFVWYCSPC